MSSRFFIERPILSIVLSIIITLAGLLAMRVLPIAQYPNIIPPDIVISTNYPGASAEVIASTVAAPLEEQLSSVPGVMYLRSSSSNSGQMTIVATFAVGSNPDQAAIDISNQIQPAIVRLPQEVRRQGVLVTKKMPSILQAIVLSSSDNSHDILAISNYASIYIVDELKRIHGVGDVSLMGARDYAMRIWLKSDKLADYNLTPNDIANAVNEQNSQFAAGSIGQEPMANPQAFTYTVTASGRFSTVQEFENIIIRSDENGAALHLKDVAKVELGALNYSSALMADGKPSVGIRITLQPGANALATANAVASKMEKLSKHFPSGIKYAIPFDTSKFIHASIDEVIKTFIIAIILVALVVYLFLQNLRATIIPIIAVPISLIGTFTGIYLLGFSINLLTLFGMILAIGIVVDDAIVVLENVERIIATDKLTPYDATIKAMQEVTSPIIAIVLVLCATFLPVGFIGGLSGEIYKQFAITIAISVIISGVVALTLTPAICTLLIKEDHKLQSGFLKKFNLFFAKLTDKYIEAVAVLMKNIKIALGIFVAILITTALLFFFIPSSLVPEEDQGYGFVSSILMPAASLSRTNQVSQELSDKILALDEVAHTTIFSGYDLLGGTARTNVTGGFVSFKPWDERIGEAHNSTAIIKKIVKIGAEMKQSVIIAFNPPPITGISLTGGFEGYLESQGGDNAEKVAAMAAKLVEAAGRRKELRGVQTTVATNVPQYYVDLDRVKTKALGVSIDSVFATMQASFGSYYINDFSLHGRVYRVMMQSDSQFREKSEDLSRIFVRSNNGAMIPLSSLIRLKRIVAPDLIDHFNGHSAAKIIGKAASGYSSGQAIQAMEEVLAESIPNDYVIGWTGAAYQEKIASGSSIRSLALGIIMTFLILAAQYRRWSLPLVVLTAVPFAIFGAALATFMRGLNNDVYFQVGLLTMIGLGAKNAILIVEFALLQQDAGMSPEEAILKAARLRFRPIVMTSCTFILGCLPLAISSGAGAASRHALGTGVIGGMIAATVLATIFVPTFYMIAMKFFKRQS